MEVRELAGGVLLREGTRCACFLPSVMRLFSLEAPVEVSTNELVSLAMQQIASGPLRESDSDLRTDARRIETRTAMFPLLKSHLRPQAKPQLGRLTLNISNACNLACTYCYAQGQRSLDPPMMQPETVRRVLERLLEIYDDIATVHFFGGEPLMNWRAIAAAGEFLHIAVVSGRLRRMPQFVATTNGTWSQPDVLETLQRWHVALTVSWDGPAEVHDACRPMQSGASSHEMLQTSLERFDECNIPYDIECTYNARHVRNGVSIVQLMEFFHKRTGRRVVHISPAYLAEPGDYEFGRTPDAVPVEVLAEEFRKAARFSMENLERGEGPVLESAYQVAQRLSQRVPCAMECPAFFTQLSVATDGAVYPCFMFMSEPAFRMGNLLDGSFPGSEATRVVEHYFAEMSSRQEAPWYACLCGGCIAGETLMTGSLSGQAMAPVAAAIAEECVLYMAARGSTHEQEKRREP